MVRIRHRSGEMAGKGNNGNFPTGEHLPQDCEGRLPGKAATTALILATGPVLGLIYAAFLPFIGIGIVTKLFISKLAGKPGEVLVRMATFNWRPAEAYLAGRRHAKKETGGEGPPAGNKTAGGDKK